MYNFKTWATNDFVPIEGQLVVLLALTGQMLHNRVWFGNYNLSVHSRALPARSPLIVRVFPSSHGIRMGSYNSRKTERTDVPMPI